MLTQSYNQGNLYYVYYRRIINNQIIGPDVLHGSGTYQFVEDVTPTSCTWSVEPAGMFQTSSGTGNTANLSYKTSPTKLAPKATLTFTFAYSCDNHYSVSKEIDLRIPNTTVSGTAVSDGFVIDTNATVTVTGMFKTNPGARSIVPPSSRLVVNGGTMKGNNGSMWSGIEVWGDSTLHQQQVNGSYLQGYLGMKVLTAELEGNRGSKALDLSCLAGGVYCYSVQCGEKTQNGKIIITK